jgi:hypothetical protein
VRKSGREIRAAGIEPSETRPSPPPRDPTPLVSPPYRLVHLIRLPGGPAQAVSSGGRRSRRCCRRGGDVHDPSGIGLTTSGLRSEPGLAALLVHLTDSSRALRSRGQTAGGGRGRKTGGEKRSPTLVALPVGPLTIGPQLPRRCRRANRTASLDCGSSPGVDAPLQISARRGAGER